MSTKQKNISVRPDVLKRLREIQMEVSQAIGFKASIADVIQYLINSYERNKNV